MRDGGWLAVADLDLDGGAFHSDPTGVRHHGFDRDEVKHLFARAGFIEIEVDTAHTITREVQGHGERCFTIFLITGRKP